LRSNKARIICATRVRNRTSCCRPLAQLANRRRRHIDADDALAAECIRESTRIQPIGLRRVAGFQPRLPRIDDRHLRAGRDDRIHERPRRAARFHGDVRRRATVRAELREALRIAGEPPLPLPIAARPDRAGLKKRLV
jgi:hypothetical protein